jgi:hypothetical protein
MSWADSTTGGWISRGIRPLREIARPAAPTVSVPSPDIPAEYRDRVLSLQRRRNWDGEGAEPVTAAACRAALQFVALVRSSQPGLALPRVAPSAYGAVSLYWRNGEEHLVLKIASGDLKRIAFHWEGPGARDEDGMEDSRGAVGRVLAFHGQLSPR